MTRITRTSVAAATTALLALGGAATAGATPAYGSWNNGQSTFQMGYGNSHNITNNGTATVTRVGDKVTVAISFGTGSAFDASAANLQICSSTSPFTSKVAGQANCTGTPGGTWWVFTETAGAKTATETITLPSSCFSKSAYLQIHATSNDGGTVNTTMVNPVPSTPLYGNLEVPSNDVPLSAGGNLGLLVIVALGAGGLGYLSLRSRRRSASSAA